MSASYSLELSNAQKVLEAAAQKQLLLEQMISTIDVAIWSVDTGFQQYFYVSDALTRITGYPPGSLISIQNWRNFIHREDIPLYEAWMSNVERGISDVCEYRIYHASGEIRWVQVRIMPLMNKSGQLVKLQGIMVDITSRKEAEEQLYRSEQRYKSLFDHNSDVICELDVNGRIMDINPAAEKITGERLYEAEIQFPFEEVFGADNLHKLTDHFNLAMKGQSCHYEVSSRHKNGGSFHWSMENVPIYVNGRIEGTFVIARDVTAVKKVEGALQESDERYRRLVELSPVAIAVYKECELTYINPAGKKMLGINRGEALPKSDILDWVHRDYRRYALERMANTLQNGYLPPGEYRIVRADGATIDVSMISIYDAQSASIQLMFEDITVRKQTEQSVRESEERHFRLQTSLDRFSHDLFGVMKVSHLERRFVKEVSDVLSTDKAAIIEADSYPIKLCELHEADDGYFLKIGEMNGKSKLLRIDGKPEALNIGSKRIWLETIGRYASVLLDNFLLIEDLTKELAQTVGQQIAPPWLLRLLFKLSENERKLLSQDLHDSALQEQIIWYRKLEDIRLHSSMPGEFGEQLGRISQGLLDVIYQIRITCNELRPPMLKEEGLVSSLQALFDFTQLRSNYCIKFDHAAIEHTLNDDQLIGLYRIVQELLANASKHSGATEVHISLSGCSCCIQLHYEDNGIGMELKATEDSFNSMGIYGMKERVRSLNGSIEFRSPDQCGLTVFLSIPLVLQH